MTIRTLAAAALVLWATPINAGMIQSSTTIKPGESVTFDASVDVPEKPPGIAVQDCCYGIATFYFGTTINGLSDTMRSEVFYGDSDNPISFSFIVYYPEMGTFYPSFFFSAEGRRYPDCYPGQFGQDQCRSFSMYFSNTFQGFVRVAPVPGPIVGAGLPGALALFGMGGWAWRRRKVVG